MDRPRVVFFLGAGFSTDGRKLPVMSAFGRRSDRQALNVQEWKESRYSYAELKRACDEFKTLQIWCRQAEEACSFSPDNLEDLASILEMLEGTGAEPLPGILKDLSLAQLRRSFNFWVWFLYRTCPPFDWKQRNRFGSCDWPQDRFVRALRDRVQDRNFVFVTTNYDVVLEAVAWRQDWPLTYPGLDAPAISRQSHTDNPQQWGSYLGSEPSSPIVCKLHGSVNFSADRDPFDKSASLKVLDLVVPKNGRVGGSRMPMDSPVTHPVDSFHEYFSSRNRLPAIVPPTYAKLGKLAWLQTHWHAAFENVRRATDLVFVGYSLPQSDGFMRGFIQSAIAARDENDPLIRILVVDPSSGTWSRFRRLFAPAESSGRLGNIRSTLEHSLDRLVDWLDGSNGIAPNGNVRGQRLR